jgi:pilus assembly protein CpaE
VLLSADTGPAVYSAAMDAGARGVAALPLTADELTARVQAAASWAAGMRRHLGAPGDPGGPSGTVVTVSGAKGGVGSSVAAVQIALAARASGVPVALVDLDLQTGDLASYLDVRFRRSVADLAEIADLTPRVLADAMFTHASGLSLLLAPAEGEQGEAVGERAARALVAALRSRFAVTVVDCGSHLDGAGAAVVELADTALLLTTPDVVSVRAARRTVRMWDRLRVRKPQDVRVVVNRLTRQAELQPPLVERITGTPVTRTCVPAAFRELQTVVDSGHLDELDARSTVRQALWALAAEIGVVTAPAAAPGGPPALPPARRLGRRTPTPTPGAGAPGGS